MTTNSFFTSGTVIIPANQTVHYNCTGQLFICKEASDVFKMSFNDGEQFQFEVGLGFRLDGADEFTKLSFKNETASAITINFYTGRGEIRDARLNTTVNRLMSLAIRDLPDYSKGYGEVGTPLQTRGHAGVTYPGTDSETITNKGRKQIVITNVSVEGNLWITDASDRPVAVIPPGQAWTMNSNATFKVWGDPVKGQVDYIVGETFWLL